jgi:hypothetical protein
MILNIEQNPLVGDKNYIIFITDLHEFLILLL